MKTNVKPAEGKLGILVVGCGASGHDVDDRCIDGPQGPSQAYWLDDTV